MSAYGRVSILREGRASDGKKELGLDDGYANVRRWKHTANGHNTIKEEQL